MVLRGQPLISFSTNYITLILCSVYFCYWFLRMIRYQSLTSVRQDQLGKFPVYLLTSTRRTPIRQANAPTGFSLSPPVHNKNNRVQTIRESEIDFGSVLGEGGFCEVRSAFPSNLHRTTIINHGKNSQNILLHIPIGFGTPQSRQTQVRHPPQLQI